jgi:hypothetical protein
MKFAVVMGFGANIGIGSGFQKLVLVIQRNIGTQHGDLKNLL